MSEENEPGLRFVHYKEGDFLERTIGKILSIPFQHIGQATYGSIFKEIPPENIEWLKEKFKDVKWQGDVEVHMNHSPFWRQIERLFEKERPRSLFSRVVLGIPVTLWTCIAGRLTNWNLYNPYADVVQLYNENKYMNLSKINVAQYIHERSEDNTLWQEALSIANTVPVILNTLLFIKTNYEALKKLNEEEYQEGSKYLVANSASEGIIDAVALLAALAGLKELNIPDNVKEALNLEWYEQLGLGAGVAGGISLYSELTQKNNLNPHSFFDETVTIDSVSKKEKKKKQEVVNPFDQLSQLAL